MKIIVYLETNDPIDFILGMKTITHLLLDEKDYSSLLFDNGVEVTAKRTKAGNYSVWIGKT